MKRKRPWKSGQTRLSPAVLTTISKAHKKKMVKRILSILCNEPGMLGIFTSLSNYNNQFNA